VRWRDLSSTEKVLLIVTVASLGVWIFSRENLVLLVTVPTMLAGIFLSLKRQWRNI
jgi:hypothetical protein